METRNQERPYRDLGLLLGVALALRLFYLFGMTRVLDTADAIHYIATARHLAAGTFSELDHRIPLLYPLLTALSHTLFSDWEVAAGMVSLIGSVLLVIPTYVLSRRMHGVNAARVAGIAVALWPWLADYGARVAPDMLGCFFWLLGACLLVEGIRGRWEWGLGAALAFFALQLTRPEGVMILAATPLAAVILCWGRDVRRLLRLGPFGFMAAALVFLNTWYMRTLIGESTADHRAKLILRDLDYVQMAATGLKSFCDTLPVMLGPVLLLFLGVGVFGLGSRDTSSTPRRDWRLEGYLIFLASVQFGVTLSVLSPEPRYIMAVIVVISLWSARGIALITQEAGQLPWGRFLRPLPVLALVGLMLTGTAASVAVSHLGRRSQEPSEYKVAGCWMKENLTSALIFTRKPQIGYYAEMPTTGPDKSDSLDDAITRARNVGARYFVVDERYTVPMVPALEPLLEPTKAPAALKFIKDFPEYPHSRIVIYEVVTNVYPEGHTAP